MDELEDDLEWLIDDDAEVPEAQPSSTEKNEEEKFSETREAKIDSANTGDSADDDTDDEYDGLTPDEREILERNTLLNDASDRDDYDLKNKVEKANADLERIDDLDSSRETKVMFKKKLVDVEAPPLDYSSDDSSSSSSSNDSDDEAKGNALKQDDKAADDVDGELAVEPDKDILVEKGGKFELMSGTRRSSSSSTSSSEDEMENVDSYIKSTEIYSQREVVTTPVAKSQSVRPSSAPVSQSKPVSLHTASMRPGSASRSNEYSYIKSPYAMSPEMKELMRKRAAARFAREAEERARERAQREEDRQNAEYAWKSWCDRKDQEIKERKRLEEEKRQQEKDKPDTKKEAKEAYQMWLREKKKQNKKLRMQEQQRQLEVDEGWYRRDRRECDQAYKRWLRQKNSEAQVRRTSERKSFQQTRAEAYRMKKLKRLLRSIQESQKYSY